MASKQRASLRRKKLKSDGSPLITISENDDDCFEVKSPNRRIGDDKTGHTKGLSPGLRSSVPTRLQSPDSSKSKLIPDTGDRTLDDSSTSDKQSMVSSQAPTPSKWNYLLPDFNSQPDGVVVEVLWDCASPDAVKHLRRVQKDNNNIKELIKFVKDPTDEVRSQSPPYQLPLLRASLQKMQNKKPSDVDKRKQKKLARIHKQETERKERQKQLLKEMLSAVVQREELEAKEHEAKQRETSAEAAATNTEYENDEDDENCWEDDELFENNSFIIAATQNPYQMLQESAKTSTHILTAEKVSFQCKQECDAEKVAFQCKQECDAEKVAFQCNQECGAEKVAFQCKQECGAEVAFQCKQECGAEKVAFQCKQCGAESPLDCHCGCVSNSVEESQNLDVIPPTYMSQKLKKCEVKPRNLFVTVFSKQNAEDDRNQDGAPVELQNNGGGPENCSSSTLCNTNIVPSMPAFSSELPFPGCVIGKSESNKCSSNVSTSVSNRELPKKIEDISIDEGRSEQSRATFQANHKSDHSSAVRNGQTIVSSSQKFIDSMCDDGVSDDLFFEISEPSDLFNSQKIQEYPTQAPAKLCTAATLISTKPVSTKPATTKPATTKPATTKPASTGFDFADELDAEILASICEYDSSFCDSPMTRRTKAFGVKSVAKDGRNDRSPGHTHSKQLKLQGGAKTTCLATSGISTDRPRGDLVVSAKPKGITSKALLSTKPKVVSTKAGLSIKSALFSIKAAESSKRGQWSPSSADGIGVPKPQNARPAAYTDIIFPPFAGKQQNRSKPLSSLAMGITVSEKPFQSGKKFTFKPTQSSLALVNGAGKNSGPDPSNMVMPAPGMPPVSTMSNSEGPLKSSSSLDVSCSQLKLDSTDELMDDDPIYESQIMAILDQAESQVTQHMMRHAASSQDTCSTQSKCSQEEIEKKRQAAMERRLRSRTK